jgi:transposase
MFSDNIFLISHFFSKKMKELRPAIIRMHQRGKAKREIACLPGIGESTVRKAIQRHEETGTNKDRPGRGRKKTTRNQRNIKRVF